MARSNPAVQVEPASTARLRFADGVEREIPVGPGSTLLAAALDHGIRLEHQCLSGSCGTCVCHLVEGEEESSPGRSLSLLPSEIAGGYRLACSTMPVGDTVWQFDYPSTATDPRHVFSYPVTVEALKNVSEGVFELSVRLTQGAMPFEAGQYVRLKLPGGTARSISMSSAPHELPLLRFLIRYVPGGVLSEYLRDQCTPGATLEVEGPLGTFILPKEKTPLIFVAGGTGLAPVLSMIDFLRENGAARHPMLLCFGTGRAQDLFYQDEIELRQFWIPKLSVRLACDERSASPASAVRTGSVVSLIEAKDIAPETWALLCGPPGMVAAAAERLQEFGLSAERIITERFNAS